MIYRTDIDSLRAVAVISVVLFHLGFLPNGYLGVDIFFVISGYLITSIIFDKAEQSEFSILDFYFRRIRRIIPLLLATTMAALIIGIFLMLPDDLDNLAQSVFASNFSANNILMYISSSDYWSIKNEYKPLMHTWSLGVEEQFYIIFPLIFLFLQGTRSKLILPTLGTLTLLSLSFFIFSEISAEKFYFLHYRLFEFTAGGVAAIYFKNRKIAPTNFYELSTIFSITILLITLTTEVFQDNSLKIIITVLSTTSILTAGKLYLNKKWYKLLFTNQTVVKIGKISFSIYMVHQVIFAFARYAYLEKITTLWALVLITITILISYITYKFIESPFRDIKLFSTRKVLFLVIPVFLVSSTASLYIYALGGIIKDHPELNIYKDHSEITRELFKVTTNIHIQYNEDVRQLDKDFDSSDSLKILVIGNSYGRDVTNILLESNVSKHAQIRYFDSGRMDVDKSFSRIVNNADRIILAGYRIVDRKYIRNITSYHPNLDRNKIWVFGTKSYGTQNGIYYHEIKRSRNYDTYRTHIPPRFFKENQIMKNEWGDRFIDLMKPITDVNQQVLVFTPNGKFISPDTAHLTESGARFYATVLAEELQKIING